MHLLKVSSEDPFWGLYAFQCSAYIFSILQSMTVAPTWKVRIKAVPPVKMGQLYYQPSKNSSTVWKCYWSLHPNSTKHWNYLDLHQGDIQLYLYKDSMVHLFLNHDQGLLTDNDIRNQSSCLRCKECIQYLVKMMSLISGNFLYLLEVWLSLYPPI